jgi:hypothetical protein
MNKQKNIVIISKKAGKIFVVSLHVYIYILLGTFVHYQTKLNHKS